MLARQSLVIKSIAQDLRLIVPFSQLFNKGVMCAGPSPSRNYSMSYYVKFVLSFLDALGVKRVVCVGNSAGGLVAWHVAFNAPERVDRLVLIAASGYPRHGPVPIAFRMMMSHFWSPVFERILPRSAIRSNIVSAYGDPGKVTPDLVRKRPAPCSVTTRIIMLCCFQ